MPVIPPVGRAIGFGVFLLIVTAARAAAQVDRGELQIVVTDPTGLGLRAAGTLASEAPQLYRAFTTDEDGRFTLQLLPFGAYRLIVERTGFFSYSSVVDIRSAVPKVLRIELSLAPIRSHIEVSAERPLVDTDRTGVSYTISAPQIRAQVSAVPGRTLLDLIDQQPGWLMEANGVLHPRGAEYQTLFVVDGVPMDENRSPAFAPDLPEGDVTAISVLTGNFPAEYGRKLSGVVEVTTNKDIEQGLHGMAEMGGGSFGTALGSGSATYGWRRRSLTATASAARTRRYLDPPVTANDTNTGSMGGAALAYQDRPTDGNRVRLLWRHRETSFQVPNEHLQQAAGQRQDRTGVEDFAQAAWMRVVGARAVFNTTASVQRLSATLSSNPQSTPIVATQDRSFTRTYANATLAYALGHHQIKLGGDAVFAPVREQLDYRITDPSFFERGTTLMFHFADRRHDREQSAFVQDSMSLGRFAISAGLRWDHYALVVDDHALSPRLGVAWAWPGADVVLRASFDRVFQTPAVENLLLASSPSVDVLSPHALRLPVRPSRGNFVETGVTAALARTARLDVTVYRRTFTHFADDEVFLNTGISFPIAFSSARVHGLDAKLTLPRWGRAGAFLSYSWLNGTAELPVAGGLFLGEAAERVEDRSAVPITQDQRQTIRGQFRYEPMARAWTTFTVRYGSGLPVELDTIDRRALAAEYGGAIIGRVDFERGRVRSNLSLDVGVGVHVWQRERRRLVVRGEAANLTNRLNVINFAGLFSGTAVGPPRSGAVRLQYEF